MKFNLKDHPTVLLFFISLVLLATVIVFGFLFKWSVFVIPMIVIAGLAVLVLGFSMIKDISEFSKKKNSNTQDKDKGKDED